MRGADEKLDIRGVRIGVRDEIKWNKIRALELYFSGKLSVRAINVYWGYREVGDGQMERTVPCYAPWFPTWRAWFVIYAKPVFLYLSGDFPSLLPSGAVRGNQKDIDAAPNCFHDVFETHSLYSRLHRVSSEVDSVLQREVVPRYVFGRKRGVTAVI